MEAIDQLAGQPEDEAVKDKKKKAGREDGKRQQYATQDWPEQGVQ